MAKKRKYSDEQREIALKAGRLLGMSDSQITRNLKQLSSLSREDINKGRQLQKSGGKYFAMISGTKIKREISSHQYAGMKRASNRLRDNKGRMISNFEDSRFKVAAKNAGEENTQDFVNENISRLREYPDTYDIVFHIGAAIKAFTSFRKFDKVFFNGKKSSFTKVLGELFKINNDIDSGQAKGSTPNIMVDFEISESNGEINVSYDP